MLAVSMCASWTRAAGHTGRGAALGDGLATRYPGSFLLAEWRWVAKWAEGWCKRGQSAALISGVMKGCFDDSVCTAFLYSYGMSFFSCSHPSDKHRRQDTLPTRRSRASPSTRSLNTKEAAAQEHRLAR